MCIQPGLSTEDRRIASGRHQNLAFTREPLESQSSPSLIPDNLNIKIEDDSEEDENSDTSSNMSSPRSVSHIELPSLGEFDQGVEELARAHGPAGSSPTPSPLLSVSHETPYLHGYQAITTNPPAWSIGNRLAEDPAQSFFMSRRGTITSLSQYALAVDQASQNIQEYDNLDNNAVHGPIRFPSQLQKLMDSYPSPPPEGEVRHINQKYTTEEGDFIIYAWHDKKMKWLTIKQEFATMFGRIPERTVQGLQAWYYRMNLKIPVWDNDGWLVFENEDDLEPKQVSIKCRQQDSQDKPTEPLGLAQRYPDRAMHYNWVEPEFKHRAQDWAAKRELQYRQRRERRRRKEQQRRPKL